MKLTIDGDVPSQKNGKQIAFNRKTQRRFVTSNPRVKAWRTLAVDSLQEQFNGLKISGYPIQVTLVFYFSNLRRHDLDNAAAGVMDAMTEAGVIVDDNVSYVDTLTLQYGGHDKQSPRVEIFLDD